MARRRYSVEFKKSAVQLVKQQGYTVPEAARSLGIDPSNIREWVKKFGEAVGQAAPGTDAALRSENQRLRKENGQLRLERDILKKAAAFFARDHL